MGQQSKFLVTEDGTIDLASYRWDDALFSDLLVRENTIDSSQALDISRSLREDILQMELKTITIPLLEEIVEAKLLEFGLAKTAPIKLDSSMFLKEELKLSENAVAVLRNRYLKKDSNGNVIEGPEQMFRRVAHHIALAEKKYGNESSIEKVEDTFYKMMTEFRFLPNSPTLMNAGRRLGQLAACFVLPVDDSMEGIFDSLKNAALIHKSGGGTGFSFSRLRPSKSRVGTTGGVASGPISFMKIFNTATEQVKQGGTRRGANMGILRVDHPDIKEFIYCKRDNKELNNFNISVGVTDAFMEAVKTGADYDLIDPRDNRKIGEASSTEIYNSLIGQAWDNGDPGIVFLDRINDDNPTPELGEIESTNPCGEQPLLPMEACNLGSINLAKYVIENQEEPAIDYESLKELIWWSVRFLDNTIDMSKYPLPEIDAMVKSNRKVGLGIMGFADMLYQLRIPYNSERAIEVAEEVMSFIQKESHDASKYLADERGVFDNYKKSIFKDQEGREYRNATTTTIAPTGTLSILAGCSSGIEPLFALSFVRRVMDNDILAEVNPYFETVAKEMGFYSHELMDAIAKKGSIHDIEEIPEEIRRIFVTAHDVTPEWHIKMQAAFQKHTDNAVSKTVNLPRDATITDVSKVYNMAFELGCKGVTIYRDGSKENQVLSFNEPGKGEKKTAVGVIQELERPETLEGFTTKMMTGMGNLYVTVTEFNGRPFEIFATIGKSGRSTTAKTEAIGRLVSLALRSGVAVNKIVSQLEGIGGEYPVFQKDGLVLSIPDAISRVLKNRYMSGKDKPEKSKTGNSLMGEKCPECGQTISFEEGCMTCHFCGYSKCG